MKLTLQSCGRRKGSLGRARRIMEKLNIYDVDVAMDFAPDDGASMDLNIVSHILAGGYIVKQMSFQKI